MTETDTILEVRNLNVVFDTVVGTNHAVQDVSFSLTRGQTLSLVGESGSGKSVTAYSIMRLIQKPGRIVSGRITLYPKDAEPVEITTLKEKDPRLYAVRGGLVGMIFQEPMTALSPVIPIGRQVAEAALLHRGVTRKEAEKMTVEVLGKVGIVDPEKRFRQYPFEFSGGMRQRVVIAMALITRPQLLIADEPTTALDVTIQAQILNLINELKNEFGMSVLFITHDLGVVAQIADEVVVMNRARMVESADVYQIFDHPLHPYTRKLFAAMPRIDRPAQKLSLDAISRIDPPELPPTLTLRDPGTGVAPVMVKLEGRRRIAAWQKTSEGEL